MQAGSGPSSLIPAAAASDSWFVFSVLSVCAAAGFRLGSTAVGRALSGPVCAMAITFGAAAAGVLPAASLQVAEAQGIAVRLATPLLLLRADLRAVASKASSLLPAFIIGALGTIIGTTAAIGLLRAPLYAAFGAEGLKVACALAAKNVGGGLNFVAVAAALQLAPMPMAAALAVDNVMALVYFPLCSWLGRNEADPAARGMPESLPEAATTSADGAGAAGSGTAEQSACLALALTIVAASRRMASAGYDVPLATLLTVTLATLAPRLVGPLAPAGDELGTLVLFLFFASAGWTGGAISSSLVSGGGVDNAISSRLSTSQRGC